MTGFAPRCRSFERQRGVEAAVLTVLVERFLEDLTVPELRRTLTSVESTPEREAAIGRALDGLIEAGLVVWAADSLRLTTPARRAGELELGL
jgi:hypothetical protein